MTATIDARGADLAWAVIDEIIINPDEWNQAEWRSCFAGIAIRLTGGVMEDDLVRDPDTGGFTPPNVYADQLLGLELRHHTLYRDMTECDCFDCDPATGFPNVPCLRRPITIGDLEEKVTHLFGPRPASAGPRPLPA